MMWDEVMTRVVAQIQDSTVLTAIFGSAFRKAGSGSQETPLLEWLLLGDTEGELWAPIAVQFSLWTSDSTTIVQAERILRGMFHKDLPIVIDDVTLWAYFTDGQDLNTPDRSNIFGRAIRFRFEPLRRQYALRAHGG